MKLDNETTRRQDNGIDRCCSQPPSREAMAWQAAQTACSHGPMGRSGPATPNRLDAPQGRGYRANLKLPKQRKREGGFTLTELAVTMGVLVLLVLLFTQLLSSSANITILGHKQMDADSQARQLLDRMAIDFAQMVKRSDVDYYLKAPTNASDCGACGNRDWTGNDQAAFYSTVPGYYPTPTATPTASPIGTSPVSLVSYRVNSDSASAFYNKMQRMGKSLAWNGVSPGFNPNSSLTPVVFLPQTIGGPQPTGGNWPSAVSSSATDADCNNTSCYELTGPQVFRFEYYYLLKGVNGTTYNPIFTDTPWDIRILGHTNVSGLRDVAAIIVDIAVIDPKSTVLLTDPASQLAGLAGQLGDYSSGMVPGKLLANWRTALDANVYPNGLRLPAQVISGIRVYERYFYLNQ